MDDAGDSGQQIDEPPHTKEERRKNLERTRRDILA